MFPQKNAPTNHIDYHAVDRLCPSFTTSHFFVHSIWLIFVFHVKHFCFAMLRRRETVCCLPSYPTRKASGTGHLLVCLPHFGLRPVRLDRLRICPFQARQRQQNISLICAHKAGLSFAKILNCGGQQRSLFSLSWTQSIAKETNKLVSSAPRLSGGVN